MNSTKFPMRGLGVEPTRAYLKFDVNGTSSPAASTWEGDLKGFVTSITYGATGLYTIVFNSRFTPAEQAKFIVSQICESGGTQFRATQVGGYTVATRTVVVQTQNSSLAGAAITAPATAGNACVLLELLLNDSSAR